MHYPEAYKVAHQLERDTGALEHLPSLHLAKLNKKISLSWSENFYKYDEERKEKHNKQNCPLVNYCDFVPLRRFIEKDGGKRPCEILATRVND